MSNIKYQPRLALRVGGENNIPVRLHYAAAFSMEGDAPVHAHTHPYTEFCYLAAGELELNVEGKAYPVSEGEMIVINAGVLHNAALAEGKKADLIVIGVEGLSLTPTGSEKWVNSCLFLCREFRREILFCMQQILAELEKQRSEYQKVCGCMLQSFLIYLNREGQEEFSFSSPKRTARECLAIKQYIDEHYRNTITLDHLAQISSLNKYYLAHAFREYIGLSPINYLNSRRVEEAMKLLEETNHSIAHVAKMIGFSSQSYFAQVFQKAAGMSPGEFRKRSRRKEKERDS